MAVSQKLLTWRQLALSEEPLSSSAKWFARFFSSKVSCLVHGLSYLFIICGVIHSPTSNGIDAVFGYYSDFYGQIFLILQRDNIRSFIKDLADVVQKIEFDASPPVKVVLHHADRSIHRIVMYFSAFYTVILCSLLPESIMTGKSHGPMWPQAPGAIGNWLSAVLFCASLTTGAGVYFTLWTLICSVLITLSALIRALDLQLGLAASKREVKDLIKCHQRIRDLSQSFEILFAGHLMHLLASSFLVPLLCTFK
ncbi:Odorant receptor 31, partial [Frankliniella occidentalis]